MRVCIYTLLSFFIVTESLQWIVTGIELSQIRNWEGSITDFLTFQFSQPEMLAFTL